MVEDVHRNSDGKSEREEVETRWDFTVDPAGRSQPINSDNRGQFYTCLLNYPTAFKTFLRTSWPRVYF